MAAEDFLTEIYTQIWALLEGHTPWAVLVRPGNRIKLDKPQPSKTNRQDADTIEATLWPAEIEDSGFSLTENYALMKLPFVPAAQSWVERITASYKLDLVSPNLKIAKVHQVILESLTALRKAGPRLGLAFVARWGPVTMAARPDGELQEVSGTWRVVSSLLIPVQMNLKGESLIT